MHIEFCNAKGTELFGCDLAQPKEQNSSSRDSIDLALNQPKFILLEVSLIEPRPQNSLLSLKEVIQ